jgi:hypothetical protein
MSVGVKKKGMKENKSGHIRVVLSSGTVGTKDLNCLQDITAQSAVISMQNSGNLSPIAGPSMSI